MSAIFAFTYLRNDLPLLWFISICDVIDHLLIKLVWDNYASFLLQNKCSGFKSTQLSCVL